MSSDRFDLMVVFGAGEARGTKRLAQSAERLVAVEPRPEAARALRGALRESDTVIQAAAGFGRGHATLTQYDLVEYTSAHGPTGLKKLFPAMTASAKLECDRIDAGSLLTEHLQNHAASVAVIIDVNGSESEVLRSLAAAEVFSRVISVEVRCGAEPLFEHAMAADEAEAWFADAGFTEVKVRGAGFMRSVVGVRDQCQAAAAEVETARQELSERDERLAALAAEVERSRGEVATLKAQNAQLHAAKADAASALDSERSRLNDLVKSARAECLGVRQELESARAALRAGVAEAEKACEQQVRAVEAAHADEIRLMKADNDHLKAELEAAQRQADDHRMWFNSELETLRGQLETAVAEREVLGQTVRAQSDSVQALETAVAKAADREKAERLAKEAAMTDGRGEAARLATELERLKAGRAGAIARTEELQAAVEKAEKRAVAAEAESARVREEEVNAAKEARDASRADLSLALHGKALADDDLRDLRRRYAELLDVKEKQDDLLRRLSGRLTDASQYFASLPDGVLVEALRGQDADEGAEPAQKSASKATKKRTSRRAKSRKGAK